VRKQAEVWELPNVLILHVKRFVFSESTFTYQKLDEAIKYDKQIKLTARNNFKPENYDLYGVVHHSGGAEFGHYVSEIRDLSKRDEESWHYCNDSMVQDIDEPETDSNTAYLLFYAKSDANDPLHYNKDVGYKKKH